MADCEQDKQRDYEENFAAKAAKFEEQWLSLPLLGVEQLPERFPSPAQHYRSRMEFSLHRINALEGAPELESAPADLHSNAVMLRYVMFDKTLAEGKKPRRFTHSDLPLPSISERMPQLLHYVEGKEILAQRLFQANWRANFDGQTMLSLLYHRRLDADSEAWLAAAQLLAEALELHCVIGRSKSQLLHVGSIYLDSKLALEPCPSLHMRQNDTCFSQPNAYSNLEMLRWAKQHFCAPNSDLLELYCGIGNFTCALATNFRRILATEVVRQSIRLCHHNLKANHLNNVAIGRLSAAETAQALAGERLFKRLSAVDLASYKLKHLLLDPPRNGLDKQCRRFALEFDNILYISCNPNALLRDLAFWHSEEPQYRVKAAAVFDQFPYTEHLEVGIVLSREY